MILYKTDSKGRLRTLEISTEGPVLIQASGLDTGKKVFHRKTCLWKNIGKANERKPEEQAILEQDALIIKKTREGYSPNKDELSTQILPMLAQSFVSGKSKVDWDNAYVQRKLDGMRCLAFIVDGKVELQSRKGVVITTMDHVKDRLSTIYKGKTIILDGELYVHGLGFQDNMKLIKKYTEGKSETVSYWIYDTIEDKPFKDRNTYPVSDHIINYVKTLKILNEDDMWLVHNKSLEEGYEGTMLRQGLDPYKNNTRSNQLLKVKEVMDDTFEVVDIVPMEVYVKQGMVVCKNSSGDIFKATPKMSHESKEDLLLNRKDYLGATAEIRFFELTDGGLPRFPVCVGFRLDK